MTAPLARRIAVLAKSAGFLRVRERNGEQLTVEERRTLWLAEILDDHARPGTRLEAWEMLSASFRREARQ